MKKNKIIGAVVTVALVGSSIVLLADNKQEVETTTPLPPSSDTQNPSSLTERRRYVDGTYNAIGTYTSPAGAEEVEISLAIADGVISDVQFFGKAEHPSSKTMQERFEAGFKEQVVGRSIDDVELTVVNGSSLTPKGFMDALEKIKNQAS
jgi:uncharacterized protein with FMN-binding domain